MWRPIETYEKPHIEWDYSHPKALFYSEESGVVIGRCLLVDQDEAEYRFQYDRDEYEFIPTHWMPLPSRP